MLARSVVQPAQWAGVAKHASMWGALRVAGQCRGVKLARSPGRLKCPSLALGSSQKSLGIGRDQRFLTDFFQTRGIVHVPVLAWGAGKLAAFLGTKHHVAAAITKGLQQLGIQKSLRAIREINDALLASQTQSKKSHEAIATSLDALERTLMSLNQSEQLRAFQQWLLDLEKQTPELFVAIGRAYLDTLPAGKLTKTIMGGFQTEDKRFSEAIAGLTAEEWNARIQKAFPELKGHTIIFRPNPKVL